MSAQAFSDPGAFLDHLLDELAPRQNATDQPDDDKKVVDTIREFLAQTPPHGRLQFLRYCVVWLYNNHKPDAVCPELPSDHDYQTAWNDLSEYRTKHGQTKKKILRCLRRFNEHIVQMCIFPMLARLDSTHSSTESAHPRSDTLREQCLRRDGNRCVVTRAFDYFEALKRDPDPLDNGGVPLVSGQDHLDSLEVAHIILYALGWRNDAN
ncbi:hypothetical protein AJ80_00413 [Polytolypa hystricis UAMH7299]|uniref:HNH nuclease domain-containing protein n=1 Tax=Polytolypa hystricis (strain UAMH7299) TaxID=1447883 RepID=A0A2B7Z3Q1_POLH7|nr:hypothetical protein AJ80_00413 [Polytolypa hystricis UAMH7299]